MLDLLRPFSYLMVRHHSRAPLLVNWVVPLVLSVVVTAVIYFISPRLNVFGAQGLLERMLSFIQTLVGFYIAALAAVSSFNSPHLDRDMPNPPPLMLIKYNNGNQWVRATRRRFMTAMFAFLTAASFIFSVAAVAALTVAGPIASSMPGVAEVLRPIAVVGFVFLGAQMTVVTFWGLFYLGERMLTPD